MSEKAVCKGQTSYDKQTVQLDAYLYQHKDEAVTQNGKTTTMGAAYGVQPQFGSKEFPHSLIAATLATKEHDGKLKPEQKDALAEYRKFPNSELLGSYSTMAKMGKLSDDEKHDFLKAKVEAGCVKGAKISTDGSIEFEKH
jgi:hypothetical protein